MAQVELRKKTRKKDDAADQETSFEALLDFLISDTSTGVQGMRMEGAHTQIMGRGCLLFDGLSKEDLRLVLKKCEHIVTEHSARDLLYNRDRSRICNNLPYHLSKEGNRFISIILEGAVAVEAMFVDATDNQSYTNTEGKHVSPQAEPGVSSYYAFALAAKNVFGEMAPARGKARGQERDQKWGTAPSLIQIYAISDKARILHINYTDFRFAAMAFPVLFENLMAVVSEKYESFHIFHRQAAQLKVDSGMQSPGAKQAKISRIRKLLRVVLMRFASEFGKFYLASKDDKSELLIHLPIYLPESFLNGVVLDSSPSTSTKQARRETPTHDKSDAVNQLLSLLVSSNPGGGGRNAKSLFNGSLPILLRSSELLSKELLRQLHGELEECSGTDIDPKIQEFQKASEYSDWDIKRYDIAEEKLRKSFFAASWIPTRWHLWPDEVINFFDSVLNVGEENQVNTAAVNMDSEHIMQSPESTQQGSVAKIAKVNQYRKDWQDWDQRRRRGRKT